MDILWLDYGTSRWGFCIGAAHVVLDFLFILICCRALQFSACLADLLPVAVGHLASSLLQRLREAEKRESGGAPSQQHGAEGQTGGTGGDGGNLAGGEAEPKTEATTQTIHSLTEDTLEKRQLTEAAGGDNGSIKGGACQPPARNEVAGSQGAGTGGQPNWDGAALGKESSGHLPFGSDSWPGRTGGESELIAGTSGTVEGEMVGGHQTDVEAGRVAQLGEIHPQAGREGRRGKGKEKTRDVALEHGGLDELLEQLARVFVMHEAMWAGAGMGDVEGERAAGGVRAAAVAVVHQRDTER